MNITIPKLGLTMEYAFLLRWLVAEGEHVEADQPVAEIASDKIDYEVVAPAAGRIHALRAPSEDTEHPVGTVIAELDPAAP